MSDVKVIIDNKAYDFWQDVSITRSMESIANSFSITVTDKWYKDNDLTKIVPQQECVIELDGDPVLTGYVDQIAPSFDANSHTFTFNGRSKAGDIVDCSVMGLSQLNNLTLGKLVELVAKPFGIEISALSDTTSKRLLPTVTVEPGETGHELLRRHALMVGALMTSDGTGRINISLVGGSSTRTILLQDPNRIKSNILKGSATFDDSKRYSTYEGKSQVTTVAALNSGDSTAKQDAEIVSSPVVDLGVTRHRPLLIITENSSSVVQANSRTQWEMANRVGQSFNIKLTVQGWRDAAGDLLTPNTRVRCQSKILRQTGKEWLIISQVTYKKSLKGGTTCDITLKRVDSFIPESEKPKIAPTEQKLNSGVKNA